MRQLRLICGVLLIIIALSSSTFAGDIQAPGLNGPQESPGVTGPQESPGLNGPQESPGLLETVFLSITPLL